MCATCLTILLLLFFLIKDCVGQNISGSYFNCPILSTGGAIPTSVHKLKPNDIKIVGAMGDSYSTGFGASLEGLMMDGTRFVSRDNKGISWSGGGDGNLSTVTTLPNILRMYNPNLKGFSTGGHKCNTSRTCSLNVAQHDATGKTMLQQAKELVKRAKELGSESFINHWKLITIYVGTNDVCTLSCNYTEEQGAEYWINNITEALNYLKGTLPRTFVNLVQLMNIGDVMTSTMFDSRMGDACTSSYKIICPCSNINEDNAIEVEDFIQLIEYYQMMLHSAISDMDDEMDNFTVVLQPFMQTVSLDQTDDVDDAAVDNFTVVLQPFVQNVTLDQTDDVNLSPFAPDCLHLSPVGHRNLAVALWNNMFERVGSKTTNLQMSGAELKCPSEAQPYLYTEGNSVDNQPGKSEGRFSSFNLVPNNKDATMLWAVWIPSENFMITQNHSYMLEVVCNDSIGYQLSNCRSVRGNITTPLTGLFSATTYKCAVFEHNRTKLLSNYSTARTWSGNVPSVPKDLILLPLISSPTKLLAVWLHPDYSNGVIDFKLYCNTVDAVSNPFSFTSASTRVHIDNLLPFTNYTCTVRARNNMGYSPYSAAAYAQVYQSGPSSPTAVSAKAFSSNTVWLQWNTPDQLNGIILVYKITYHMTGHTTKSFVYTGAEILGVTITGLKPYSNYSFTVQGITVEDGSHSDLVTITTLEARPGPVRNVSISEVTANSSKTLWLPPENPNGVILQYNIITYIFQEDTLTYEKIKAFKLPSYTKLQLNIPGLKAYRKYKISVSASTVAGKGESVGIKFMTKSSTPGPPSNAKAIAISSNSLLIEWSFPTDPRGTIRGYKVKLSTSSKFADTEIVYQKDFRLIPTNYLDMVNTTVSGLVPYSVYYAMVQAYAFEYDPREIRHGMEVIKGPVYTLEAASSPPTKVTGTPKSSTSIDVSWSTPDNTNGIIKYFEVIYYPKNEAKQLQVVHVTHPAESTQLKNLKMYTFYVISVRAFTVEYSENSSMALVQTLQDAPSAPIMKMAKSDSPDMIYIAWDPPKQMNGLMKMYTVKYFTSEASEKQAMVERTTQLEMNITGLDPATLYSIVVTASTEVAEGPQSQMMSLQTASKIAATDQFTTEAASEGSTVHATVGIFQPFIILVYWSHVIMAKSIT